MKNLNTQQLVKEVFEKDGLAQSCYEAVLNGFSDYKKFDAPRGHIHSKSLKAGLINSYVRDHFVKLIATRKHKMFWHQTNLTTTIVISDRIISRPKKIGNGFVTKNFPTKIVQSYRSHDTEKLYKSSTKLIPVDIAYYIDDVFQNVIGVFLICPNGKKNLWVTPFYHMAIEDKSLFSLEHWIKVKRSANEGKDIQRLLPAKLALKKDIKKKKAE